MQDSDHAHIVGWDIGGAHLKVARIATDGSILGVCQYATPLWQGLDSLARCLEMLAEDLDSPEIVHAVTMTGELVDLFASRRTGVANLLSLFCRYFDRDRVVVYAIDRGLVPVDAALTAPDMVASANWQAAAAVVARQVNTGILVDTGSTTTDIVPFRYGRPCSAGTSDQERMRCGELVYTGIVRTPVMAVVQRAPFDGQWQNIAAEVFATMADVYRVTGQLDEQSDLQDAADRREKTVAGSIARLARMLGTEPAADTRMESWQVFASYLAEQQLQLVDDSFLAVRNRLNSPGEITVVGAGCGMFVAAMIAARHGHEFLPLSRLLSYGELNAAAICTCAPAVAVARLARAGITQ